MAFLIPIGFTRLPELTLAAVIDILILAFVIYQILLIIRGTRAVQILLGVALLVVVYYGSLLGRLQTIQWLLDKIFPYLVFALIVLFQGEIRRGLAKIGRNPFASRFASMEVRQASEDIVMAATTFSSQRVGALIVLERDTGLRTFTESGIPLQAKLSYDLLVAIFQRSSPLHDGAAIIRKDKIVAASCFLPLSVNPILATQLGTRHRAAIGITEETDAVAVVVSEQSGDISLALNGSIESDIEAEGLAQRLSEIFQYPLSQASSPLPGRSPQPEGAPPAHSDSVTTGNRL
jgi:diadenylate cyclase